MTRICPKCNKEITSLRNIVTGSMEYHLSLDTQGDIQYEQESLSLMQILMNTGVLSAMKFYSQEKQKQ